MASMGPFLLTHCIYRIRATGTHYLPASGGVVLVGNHVSFADVVVLQAALPRAIRYLGAVWLFERWWLRWVMKWFEVIPVARTRPREAIQRAARSLEDGEVVCLFPEGGISRDGELQELRAGFSAMARLAGAPVVPFYIDGLSRSIFSFHGGRFFWKLPKGIRPEVRISLGSPLEPDEMNPAAARRRVLELKRSLQETRTAESGKAQERFSLNFTYLSAAEGGLQAGLT